MLESNDVDFVCLWKDCFVLPHQLLIDISLTLFQTNSGGHIILLSGKEEERGTRE